VLDGETISLSSYGRNKATNLSSVKPNRAATKILEVETYQHSSELVMEILRNASSLPEMEVTNTLVCNTEENVGLAHHSVNTERDQTVSAT